MPHPHRLLPPLLLVALAFLVRVPSWPISVIDWDESMFALAARELLTGHLPYTTMFDNKPVGLSLLFAAAMAVAGETVVAVRLLGALCVATTAVLLCRLAGLVTGNRLAGFTAGVFYIAFTTGLHGLATHTEIVLAPFTTAAVLLAVAWDPERNRTARLVTVAGVGLVFGLAMIIKQVAAVPAAAVFVLLVLRWRARAGLPPARTAALAGVYALACGAPNLVASAIYAAEGQLAGLWYANVGFMGRYVAEQPSIAASLRFISGAAIEFWPLLPLGIGGLLAISAGPRRPVALLLGGWLAAETTAALVSLQFYSHHFLVMLPPLAILSAAALRMLVDRAVLMSARAPAALAAAGFLALIPLVPNLHTAGWAGLGGPDLPRRVADAVRARSGPDDLVWIVNFQPVVYLLADLPLPTALPFPPHLVGEQSRLSPIDPDREIARILGTRPRLLVVDRGRWAGMRPAAADLVGRSLLGQYRLAATVSDGPQRIEIHARR